MTPVNGYILISFIANYPTNNLYYRIGCTGAYIGPILIDCTPLIGDFVPGTECSYKLEPISFENESCFDVCYDGYLEPTCAPGDPEQQLFWEKTFTPNPTCTLYTITCNGVVQSGQVSTIDITDPGNYSFQPIGSGSTCALSIQDLTLPQSPNSTYCGNFDGVDLVSSCGSNYSLYCQCLFLPTITVSPPPPAFGNVQATAIAVIGHGGLFLPPKILNQGLGPVLPTPVTYTAFCNTPTNYIPVAPSPSTVAGIGIQKFDVTVTNGKVSNVIPHLYPDQGKWFHPNEKFSFDPADIGGVIGVLCEPSPFSIDLGHLIGVIITNPGAGYPTFPAPTFTISNISELCDGISLIQAAAIQVNVDTGTTNGPCPEFDPGMNCDNSPYLTGELIPELQPGDSFNICYGQDLPPSIPPSISITTAVGCCYDCIEVLVVASVSDPLPQIFYTNCTTNDIIIVQMTGYSLTITCAINNSWHSSESSTTFTPNGPCTS